MEFLSIGNTIVRISEQGISTNCIEVLLLY